MSTLSRETLKWIQKLDLSYSIKNYKRDFANGFLIAEILSKYEPSYVKMHSFDLGSGPSARKANWDLLERIFNKLSIPVSKELMNAVASKDSTAAPVLLNLIMMKYGIIVNSSPKTAELPSHFVEREESHLTTGMIKGMNMEVQRNSPAPTSIHLSNSHQPDTDDNVGKNLIAKYVITQILLIDSIPSNSFNRLAYQVHAIQEFVKRKFTKLHLEYDDEEKMLPPNEKLYEILAEKEDTIMGILKASMQSDVAVFLDTFIPFIVTLDQSSVLYSFSCHLVQKMGQLLFRIPTSQLSPFQRLVGTREIQNLIHVLFFSNSKSFDVARLIFAYSDYQGQISESDRVSNLLSIKTYMNTISDQQQNREHSGFIGLLSSLIIFEPNLSKVQIATLYFSESLTVLNSNKRYFATLSKSNHSAKKNNIISKSLANPIVNDCTFAVHVLAHLAYLGFSNVNNLIEEDSVLKKIAIAKSTFGAFKDIQNGEALMLGCIRLVVNMMNADQSGNQTLLDVCSVILSVLTGETLSVAKNQTLCSSFIKGLLSLDSKLRSRLMLTQTTNEVILLDWKIANMHNELITAFTHVGRDWWFFGMAMGLLHVAGPVKPFSKAHLEILQPIIELSLFSLPGFEETEIKNWKRLFRQLSPAIIAALAHGSTVSDASRSIKVLVKFGVFEDPEALRDLMLTFFYIFRKNSGLSARKHSTTLLLSLLNRPIQKTNSSLEVEDKIAAAAEPEAQDNIKEAEREFQNSFSSLLLKLQQTFPSEKLEFPEQILKDVATEK